MLLTAVTYPLLTVFLLHDTNAKSAAIHVRFVCMTTLMKAEGGPKHVAINIVNKAQISPIAHPDDDPFKAVQCTVPLINI